MSQAYWFVLGGVSGYAALVTWVHWRTVRAMRRSYSAQSQISQQLPRAMRRAQQREQAKALRKLHGGA